MQKKPNGAIPQRINVHDPAAIAAAGFGDPSHNIDLDNEINASAEDAMMLDAFNKANQVNPKTPVSRPLPGKKAGPIMTSKKTKQPQIPKVEEQPEQKEEVAKVEETEGEEEGITLSEDPAERLAQVSKALKELSETAPSPDQLSKWKQIHGDIFVLYLFDQAFVYRYLKRAEWVKMNLDESFQRMTQDQVEEYIFDRCVLWPSYTVIEKNKLPAGIVPSLSEQIRINSMFVDPGRLSQLTVKL